MLDRPDALMLFAAGFGTRMRPLTDKMPKPLIPVDGIAMIDRMVVIARQGGIDKIVVNAHYLADQIESHFAADPVIVSREAPHILDTGGGLRQALRHLGQNPVFTANPDAIWRGDNPFDRLRAAWDPEGMDALLLLIRPEQAQGHTGKGDFDLLPDGRIARGSGLIYSGVQIVRTDALAAFQETSFSLNLLWDRYIAKNRAFGCVYRGAWCDVGRPQSILLAERMLQEGRDV